MVAMSVFHRYRTWLAGVACLVAALSLADCGRFKRTETRPLDEAGMAFRKIQQLRELSVTDEEVVELAKAKRAGMSDENCVELVRIARSRNRPFSSGDAVAGLRRVGVSDATVVELARLDQLGLSVGEFQAMRLAGLSDTFVLEIARRRAQGLPSLSGPSLVRLKNKGMSEDIMLALLRGGTTDEQVEAILQRRQAATRGTGFRRYRR